MRNLYLTDRLFQVGGIIIIVFALSFVVPPLFPVAQALLGLLAMLVVVDVLLLFNRNMKVSGKRELNNVMSLGSENKVLLQVYNESPLPLTLKIIDELPQQFQRRDFELLTKMGAGKQQEINYNLRPLTRGAYHFGKIQLFARSALGLIERRFQSDTEKEVPVYPSIIEMKKYELYGSPLTSHFYGVKKIRKIGHSYEFEQIKNYTLGDDFRSINWKVTGRHNKLMVNQYEDEKSQQVYSVIDKSRVMRMPFNGLSLLDYAINASLIISKVVLQKQDKAGLLSFSDRLETTIKAENNRSQLRKIMNALYNEKENQLESNYELLFIALRKLIRHRSLVFLYANFESLYALERVLPVLRKINRTHLLVVMFFENTDISDFANQKAEYIEDIYQTTIARKFVFEKEQIVRELKRYGIQSILCKPENLNINVINKYLELKARGMI